MSKSQQPEVIIPVLAAILINDQQQVLIAKRHPHLSNGGQWEFPGGKLKRNETPELCLKREIREEMGVEIEVERPFHLVHTTRKEASILLIGYICKLLTRNWQLSDHSEIHWVAPEKLVNYPLSLPDIPIAERLAKEIL